MTKRKTPEEKIAELEHKQAQLKAQIQREKSRMAAQKRKDDTRRKIIIGGTVQAHAKLNSEFQKAVDELLSEYVTAKRDRELLGLDAKHEQISGQTNDG